MNPKKTKMCIETTETNRFVLNELKKTAETEHFWQYGIIRRKGPCAVLKNIKRTKKNFNVTYTGDRKPFSKYK